MKFMNFLLFSDNARMNESSQGGGGARGDPPIGGYPPPSSTTTPSNTDGAIPRTVRHSNGASSTTVTATSTTSNDLMTHNMNSNATPEDLDLDSGLSLTRLLAGDSNWDFNDPLGAGSATSSTSSSYTRPWEADLRAASSGSSPAVTATPMDTASNSTFATLTTVSLAPPPNVLAPPSTMPRPHAQTFYPPHGHYINQGLPSFQSQFQEVQPPPHHPAYAGGAVAVSAAAATAHPHYPLVPPPVQAREIPNIQQQFLDERHIQSQFFSHPHIAQPRPHFPTRLAAHIASTPTKKERQTQSSEHQTHLTAVEAHPTLAAQLRKKTARAGSLEGSESDHSSVDTPGQVAAISSTDPTPETLAGLADAFKPPSHHLNTPHNSHGSGIQHPTPSMGVDDDKPSKKKRKRCGECVGCQKKDNCGECAPCRNDKSHQICKLRRCDKLTEKKPRKPNVSLFLHTV